MTMLLFISPIFYSIDRLPELWQALLMLNPLSFIVEAMRGAMFYQQSPSLGGLAAYWLVSLALLVIGKGVFMRLKPAYADVI